MSGNPVAVDRIFSVVRDYTMVGIETADSMYRAASICVNEHIPGALVECGVWRGGSLMAGMLSFLELEGSYREVWAYDTFSGMPSPEEDEDGKHACAQFKAIENWCSVSQEEFEKALLVTGYPQDRINVIAGLVEKTIPENMPYPIAVLRLDTDWYRSTLHELTYLYPLLSPGGVLIIDDYGCWHGCRVAVNEYFGDHLPEMENINWTARMLRKPLA